MIYMGYSKEVWTWHKCQIKEALLNCMHVTCTMISSIFCHEWNDKCRHLRPHTCIFLILELLRFY